MTNTSKKNVLTEPIPVTTVLPSWVGRTQKIVPLFARIFPNSVAKLIAYLWFKPFMPKAKNHVSQWQNSADQILTFNKGEAFLFEGKESESQGSGETQYSGAEKPLVICIHGWRGRGYQMRRFLSPLLDRGYRVVMVNLPGHCDSDENYTHIYECADLISDIAKQLGEVDSIIAHSLGCSVATLALSEKLKLRKVVFVAGNFRIQYLLKQVCRAFGVEGLRENIDQQIRDYCERNIFKGAWDNINTELFAQNLKYSDEVLFCHDPDDTEVSIETNVEINALIQQDCKASIQEVANVGHFEILKSAAVIDSVCDFLNDK